jgi:hypothetical protein
MMKKSTPAASPDAYVAALDGWHLALVQQLRAGVREESALEERVKWGHLVYLANGPVRLVRDAIALTEHQGDPTLAARRG